MHEIGAFEAKNTLGSLLSRVEQGEEIIITRHGRPVARLVPNVEGNDRAQARAAAQRLEERAARNKVDFNWSELKTERDKGRP